MNIDVITLTDAQFALLTEEQIDKVRAAQTKKNALTAQLAADMKKQKYALVRAGIFRSCVYEKACEELTAAYDKKVATLREGLLFYLQFCAKPESGGGYRRTVRRLFADIGRTRSDGEKLLRE